MSDVYRKLAKHLDDLPGGYPRTDSGVELRILKRLFTPREAKIAASLTMMMEPPGTVAQRLDMPEDEMAQVLNEMSRKGLILRSSKSGQDLFMAAQFVIGIWEYHVNDLDEGLIRDFNEYVPYLLKTQFKLKNQQLRVIPVSQSVSADMHVMAYEQAEEIIRKQSKILVAPCICRKEHKMVGKGCNKLEEACLIFGSGAHFYEGNQIGRAITRDEALEILKKGLDDGLVLQPGNSKKPINICMCCGCCCQILKNLKSLEKPAVFVRSNFYAKIDDSACTACGICGERCQMGAIDVEDVAKIDLDRCIGCGLCVPTCEFEAIRMVQKDEADQWEPPLNTVYTYINIAKERGKI